MKWNGKKRVRRGEKWEEEEEGNKTSLNCRLSDSHEDGIRNEDVEWSLLSPRSVTIGAKHDETQHTRKKNKQHREISSIGISRQSWRVLKTFVSMTKRISWIMSMRPDSSSREERDGLLNWSPSLKSARRKLAIINWEIKILNSMTSFIDATRVRTRKLRITNRDDEGDWNKAS